MQVDRITKKCIICGHKADYFELRSNFISGTPNLDLQPKGSMASPGMEIQECPNCHYCNHDVSVANQNRFNLDCALELWNDYQEIQEIIKTEQNPVVRKYLILAEIYRGNMDNEKQYSTLIKAAWASETEKQYKDLMLQALDVYVTKVLPGTITDILQMADVARQVKEFDVAGAFILAVDSLNNDANKDWEMIEKIVKFQKELITNKDSKVHNISEIPQ